MANYGTDLSVHQILMLNRFTSNITLLYDGDEAGIKATLRGTDMILAEGMNIKVLILPDGEDPDSFARKHSVEDFKAYIEENQTDFIWFKINLMLKGVTDPAQRSEAINSIVQSIAVIPNQILRDTYIHDCAQRLLVSEATLINTMNNFIRESRDRMNETANKESVTAAITKNEAQMLIESPATPKVETLLAQMIVRYGEKIIFKDVVDENEGKHHDLSVIDYIDYNLQSDGLHFSIKVYNLLLKEAVEHVHDDGFIAERYFVHHNDIAISQLATELTLDKYQYYRTQKQGSAESEQISAEEQEEKEREKIKNQLLHLLLDFRKDYLERSLKDLQRQINEAMNTPERLLPLMKEYQELQMARNRLAKELGNSVVGF